LIVGRNIEVIDMAYELFKELIKEEMQLSDTEQVSKLDVVENALGKLALLDDELYNKQIKGYKEKKEKLFKELNEINIKIGKLVDEYYKALIEGL